MKWEDDQPLSRVIGEAVGAASVCWEDMSKTGVFQDDEASEVVDGVLEYLAAWEKKIREDERSTYDAIWRGAHEQYRRELRAKIANLTTPGDYISAYGVGYDKSISDVLNLIDDK